MNPVSLTVGGQDGREILHHLLVDLLIKGAIIGAALIVVATGMMVIWKKSGRKPADENRPSSRSR